ncbi:MAG: T9SS type A sorting domain-containing protein [Rhodothermaceae bacterium]|nr:T9SS type A sorting domain-containing protein [Rhodothermaceae bacterium]
MAIRFALLFAVVSLIAWPSAAQSWVTAVTPVPHATAVAADAALTIQFSEAIDPGSLTGLSIRVHGNRRGAYTLADVQYEGSTQTATVQLSETLVPGEELSVSVTTAVHNDGNQAMPMPFVWHVVAAVPGGTGTFIGGGAEAVGSVPYAIAASDFDGDGHLDLATADRGSNRVSILDGDGAGAFAAARTVIVGSQPEGIVAGDWNNDGAPDLATADAGTSTVTVLLNDGAGQFTTSSVAVGSGPHTIRAGDVNGDGFLDLVTSDFGAAALSVLIGDRLGGFARTSVSGTGATPELVMIRDVDADGDLDLVAPSFGGGTVRLFRNDGTGGFTAEPTQSVGTSLHGLCAGDLNDDGAVDVLAPSSGSNQLVRLTNDGSGTFDAEPSAPVSAAWFCRTGDIDGDGDLDAVVTAFGSAQVTAWRNDGTGTFTSVSTASTGTRPHGVVLGDWDEDGDLDLATANDGSASVTLRFNEGSVDIEDEPEDGGLGVVLEPIYPNPSTDTAAVAYRLRRPTAVRLTVYDLRGREMTVLVNDVQTSGSHAAAMDTEQLAVGTYLVRLEAEGQVQTQRMTVTR